MNLVECPLVQRLSDFKVYPSIIQGVSKLIVEDAQINISKYYCNKQLASIFK